MSSKLRLLDDPFLPECDAWVLTPEHNLHQRPEDLIDTRLLQSQGVGSTAVAWNYGFTQDHSGLLVYGMGSDYSLPEPLEDHGELSYPWDDDEDTYTHRDVLASSKPSLSRMKSVYCADCGLPFKGYQQLEEHGRQTACSPFACTMPNCTKRLGRRDTMQRHIANHTAPLLSCKYCQAAGICKEYTRYDNYKKHTEKCCYKIEAKCLPVVKSEPKRKLEAYLRQLAQVETQSMIQLHIETMDEVKTRGLCDALEQVFRPQQALMSQGCYTM